MDPYLEAPHLWPDFHARFVPALSDALAPLVEPRYVVTLDERVNVSYDWEGPEYMRPDVAVLRSDEDRPAPSTREGMRGASSVLIPLDMGELPREIVLEVHEQSSGKLVTVVELLSPSNKDGGSETRRKYLRKRRSIVASDTHLVELDLLRSGRRMPMGRPLPPASYYVTVSREERRPTAEVFPIELSQPLPTVPIPLLPPDAGQPAGRLRRRLRSRTLSQSHRLCGRAHTGAHGGTGGIRRSASA